MGKHVSRARSTPAVSSGLARLAQKADRENNEEEQARQLDMQRAAEQAQKEEAEQRAADSVDLLKVIREQPDAFPLEVASWNILIEMQRPKDRMGRFIKVEGQITMEQHLTVVGRVLMCGPTALSGRTESGIPLDQLTATIKTPEDLIGKFVITQRYTGNDQFFAPIPGKKLRYITATEILAVSKIAGLWMRQ